MQLEEFYYEIIIAINPRTQSKYIFIQ